MEEAEEAYRAKLSGQSKTLEAAVQQYKKRYQQDPPHGFDEWWAFAKKNNVKMVDEYDGLMDDLRPFWEISGEELRRRAGQAALLPDIDLVRIQGGSAISLNLHAGKSISDVGGRAEGFRSMMELFVDKLPDMEFPINAKAEGRVLVPWEHRVYPNLTVQDSTLGVQAMLGGPFKPDWGTDGNVWEAWRRTCQPESNARRLFYSKTDVFTGKPSNYLKPHSTTTPGDDFTFASKPVAADIDFCNTPYAHYSQGHFFSDWRSIPALYPVFSPAKAKGFLDVRIPSHYYYGNTPRYTYGWDSVNLEMKNVDSMEVPWEKKVDKVFWRGATIGGGNHPPGFAPQYHRHRFLRMTSDESNVTRRVIFADPSSPSTYVAAEVPITELNDDIVDAAFVKAISQESFPGGLKGLTDAHRFSDSVPLGKHWSYKYLIDLDGVGYSGRFMSFLASDSVPLKATVYEEFYSDWIQPWVHYIPLTATYKEIYNIHAYFSGPTESAVKSAGLTIPEVGSEAREGDKRLRRIARAGKQWKKTMGRTADMEAYVYRLCLEWARLWADDRDSMNFYL